MTAMKPRTPRRFVVGPPVQPSDTVLEWLNHPANARKRLRIPVVVRYTDAFRLALAPAILGTAEPDATHAPILLKLDDSGMGVALLTSLRTLCPAADQPCAIWIEGFWGELVRMPATTSNATPPGTSEPHLWPFAVLQVYGLLDEHPEHDLAYILIESDGGA